jgi:PKD repeat protein
MKKLISTTIVFAMIGSLVFRGVISVSAQTSQLQIESYGHDKINYKMGQNTIFLPLVTNDVHLNPLVEEVLEYPITERVSTSSDGTEGNGSSGNASISSDGRYVAFESWADNLVESDTNGLNDIFVHDRETGFTSRVSLSTDGVQTNEYIEWFSISASGRFVTFDTLSNNLVLNDNNDAIDVFIHDRDTGQTTRVSVNSLGTEGNGLSWFSSISADGRYVAFESEASNLVSNDNNNSFDIFVHDRETSQTTRVSVASDGTEANSDSYFSSLSADGRYLAFGSWASNLVVGDTNNIADIFVLDRQTGETTRVSVASDGTEANFLVEGVGPTAVISADGQYVAFDSSANNLVTGDNNDVSDVFVHNRETGETSRVSVNSEGAEGNGWSWYPSISANGRYISFSSTASNLVPGDTNDQPDVFIHDRITGETKRVSVASYGAQGNHESYNDGISANGDYVVFHSRASNLVENDTNGRRDVFVQYYVTVPPPPPTAAFVADVISGPAPLEVQFTDQSTGIIDTYLWNFDDGNSSNEQNPKHIFKTSGVFTVTLTVTGPGGSDSTQATITVTEPPPPPPDNTPPDAKDDLAVTDEDIPVTINVIENDIDIDGNLDPNSLRIERNPFIGEVKLGATLGNVIYTPIPNISGFDNFTYRICDTKRKCDIAEVTVRIYAVNDPPTLIIQEPLVIVEVGEAASNSGTVHDIEGDSVTVSASVGEVINNGDGSWSWRFNTTSARSYPVTITADDGNGGVVHENFNLEITLPSEVEETVEDFWERQKNSLKVEMERRKAQVETLHYASLALHLVLIAAECASFIGAPACAIHLALLFAFTAYYKKLVDNLQMIIDDPPDPNYHDFALKRDIKPVPFSDGSPLSVVLSNYLMILDDEAAIIEAYLTSFERLQGAIIDEDPEYILLQVMALKYYNDLWYANQIQFALALRSIADELEVYVGPIYGDVLPILLQISEFGFNNEQLNQLRELDLSEDEILYLEDLYSSTTFTDHLNIELASAYRDWATFTEETVIPSLEADTIEMTELVELLENYVEITIPNESPEANAGNDYAVSEGGAYFLDGSASDPDGGPLMFEWDLDDDGNFETTGENPLFSAVGYDGPSNHIVTLQVCDMFGACGTDDTIVEILNVSPTVQVGPDQTVYRNDPVTVSGIWTDPAESLDEPYTWNWDLDGDGLSDKTGSASYGQKIAATTTFYSEGKYTLKFEVTDKDGDTGSDSLEVEVLNRPPVCSAANPNIDTLWSPDHKFVAVDILDVTDPEDDPTTINIDGIFQDEPVDTYGDGSFTPDGRGLGTSTAEVRAERAGGGNGRVYHIFFTADDDQGGSCSGEVLVGVPKSQSNNITLIDDTPLFDSTLDKP